MKLFYNMKISLKLMLGFTFIGLIAMIVGVIGIININKLDDSNTVLYEKATVPITQTSELIESFEKTRVNLRNMIIESDANKISVNYKTVKELCGKMDATGAEFEKAIMSAEIETSYNSFTAAKKDFVSYLEKYSSLCMQNKDDEAILMLNGEMKQPAEILHDSIDTLVQLKVDGARVVSSENTKLAKISITTMIITIIIGAIFSLIIGYSISSIIIKPLKKLSKVADLVAEGDLNVNIDIHTKDEIGRLADSFRHMSDNLNDVMSNILFASEQVSVGSKQVSDSSMMLAQGATEQASSIEELTASIEQITTQTSLNTDSAVEANKLSGDVKNNALNGNNQMQLMLKAMYDINDASGNIFKIIKVIDDIAFQTNILALNAAVEAARAGQHGKGFAVVAEEVRNLAARSANAAKETTALIEGSIKKSENGTKIANDTAIALRAIDDGIAKAANLINGIAVSSSEQSAAATQISQSIVLVSQVVQTNSSTAEESSAASEELSGQAEILKEQVNKFKIKKSAFDKNSNKKSAIALTDSEFGKY